MQGFCFIVVPVLFQHSLQDFEDQIVSNLDHIFSVEPLKIKSPSTDAEVSLALRVLEGCCLLHKESMVLAHQFKAVQVPINYYIFINYKHYIILVGIMRMIRIYNFVCFVFYCKALC